MTQVTQIENAVFARSVTAGSDGLKIGTADGDFFIPWNKCSSSLRDANKEQRKNLELSPSGYGIHWFDLDEDLSIGGLLKTLRGWSDS